MSKIKMTRRVNAYGSIGYRSLAFIIAFHLAGCEPEKGDSDSGQQDSDPDSGQQDGGLGPGRTLIQLVRTRTMPDGSVTETEHAFESNKAGIAMYPNYNNSGEYAWGLWIQLVGVPTYSVLVIFKSPGPDPSQLAPGDGQGYAVGVDIPEKEQGGSSPFDGIMHITEFSGGTASGDVSVGIDIEIMSYYLQAPTGEIIRVESAAFNRIPVEGA